MDQLLYTLYTVIFVALSVWAARLWWQSRQIGTLVVLIVMLAMIYENAVLALGVVIGHGSLLEALSWGRFVGYAVIPPLLVVSSAELARRAGVAWAGRREVRIGAWVVALTLAAFALFVEVIGRQIEPRIYNDVVRYMWVSKGVPPLGVILMNLIVIGLGFAIWRKSRYAGLLLAGIFLFFGDGMAAGQYVIGSGIEMAFMVVVVSAEAWALGHFDRRAAPAVLQSRAQTHAVGD